MHSTSLVVSGIGAMFQEAMYFVHVFHHDVRGLMDEGAYWSAWNDALAAAAMGPCAAFMALVLHVCLRTGTAWKSARRCPGAGSAVSADGPCRRR